MNKKVYKLTLTICLFLLTSHAWAQLGSSHEFTLSGTIGSSKLKLSDMKENAKGSGRMGWSVGVGYKYYLSNQWGIGTGVEYALYKANLKTYNMEHSMPAVGMNGENIKFSYEIAKYEEDATAYFLKIPLMVYFHSRGNYISFYGGLGGKVGLPISKSSKSGDFVFRAKSEEVGGKPVDFAGYARYGHTDNFDLKTAFMLSAELGFRWVLPSNMGLYTSAYIEYGLNNIIKHSEQDFIGYNSNLTEDFSHNSLITGRIPDANMGEKADFVGKIVPMSIGLKIGLSFSVGGNARSLNFEKKDKSKRPINARSSYRSKVDKNEIRRKMNQRGNDNELDGLSLPEIQRKVDKKQKETYSGSRVKEDIRKIMEGEY